MFYQTFLSPQVKRCAIITYKHGIYELPHKLPNDLRLRKLGNIRRVPKPHRMIPQRPCQIENFVNAGKKLLKNRNFSRSALPPHENQFHIPHDWPQPQETHMKH